MLTIYDFASCILCGAVTYPCSAAAHSRVAAALLGRFLPRLGPLATPAVLFSLPGDLAPKWGLRPTHIGYRYLHLEFCAARWHVTAVR
jgi:hypothetical protein